MSYDAMVMDGELKDALQNVMGVETLETEELQGFTLRTHSGTGIQYLVRAGEEGRGGKGLLQSQADIKKYEALAETYFNKYPNLIHDKNAAYIWADLEIKGLAQRTDNGIISMGFDGMSYNDNENYKNNWSVRFSEDIYKAIFGWLQNNEELEQAGSQESETTTEIIVKPDGSRVLMMTMSIGGMETTMSLEISKPTEAPNENSEQDADNKDAEDFIIVIQKVDKRIPVGIDGLGRASFFIYKEIRKEPVKADGKISLFHEDQPPFRTRAGTLRCTFPRCTDRVPLSAAHTAL